MTPILATPSPIDRWLMPTTLPDAPTQLVCFHHAGGGASGFTPWRAHLAPEVEVLAVQLPGRENRFGEPLETDAERVLAAIEAALEGRLRGTYAAFGHSLGALIAYAWTRRRLAAGEPAPAALIVSAAPPPGTAPLARHSVTLPDAELLDLLQTLGGTPPSVLENPLLAKLFLPVLRADMALALGLQSDRGPVAAPIVVLGGDADPSLPPTALKGWARFSSVATATYSLPGGHFFPQTALGQVLAIVRGSLGVGGGVS